MQLAGIQAGGEACGVQYWRFDFIAGFMLCVWETFLIEIMKPEMPKSAYRCIRPIATTRRQNWLKLLPLYVFTQCAAAPLRTQVTQPAAMGIKTF